MITVTFAIDNTQVFSVTARTYCKKISVRENYNAATPPTADLRKYVPSTSATPENIPQGTDAVFEDGGRHFYPGEVVGGINTLAGAITVIQVER